MCYFYNNILDLFEIFLLEKKNKTQVCHDPDKGATPIGWVHELSNWHKTVTWRACSRGSLKHERQKLTSQQLIHHCNKERVKERMAAAASEPD